MFFILLGVFLITVFFHQYFNIKLYKSRRHLLVYIITNLVLGSLWDQFVIARGHWSFNQKFLLDPKIGFMPIEEFFFISVLGYFGVVFFKVLEKNF
ncbi:MAG: lycopene cyclase domain-containing protein [Nitrosopumilales archaeon]|nr:MAG: lycopene cyclase domain-containing protein [Nitrosopumilales archaeon]